MLFLEYEFTIVYKPNRTHVVAIVLSILPNNSLGVLDQVVDASWFCIQPMWMQEIKTYLEIGQMLEIVNLAQK